MRIALSDSRWFRRFLPKAVLVSVLVAFTFAGLLHFLPDRAELNILCSNNRRACDALAREFQRHSATSVQVFRVPTSQALERLARQNRQEFDVWIGGPTDAYVTAEQAGYLHSFRHDEISASTPSTSNSWFEIYGGILSLCVSDGITEVDSWESLANSSVDIAAPNPLTSGTAAVFLALQYELSPEHVIERLRKIDSRVAIYTDSGTAPATLVAKGRADVGITFAPYCDSERDNGANVHTVYPKDGTSYEIGGVAVLENAPNLSSAIDFVASVISDGGQALGASVANQAPISARLPANLSDRIAKLSVPVVRINVQDFALRRSDIISKWVHEVRNDRL